MRSRLDQYRQYARAGITSHRLRTLIIGALGALLFKLLGMPLPLLLGPLFACLIAGLSGVGMADTGKLGTLMRTILGVAVGAAITPDLLLRLPEMGYSVALVPPFILIIGLIGYPFFKYICGFDGPTAFYAAMPGGFQDMVVFGEEAGADVRALSLVHATRVMMIVSLAPLILTLIYGRSLDAPLGSAVADIPMVELMWMGIAAVVGWKVAERIGLFGAAILGPLILTAVLSLTGIITHRPPAVAILAAQFFIGSAIGAKYAGVTWRELRVDVLSGAAFCLVLCAITLGFAEIAIYAGWAPDVEALLSFAPGGQGEMAVLAIVTGADLAFVVTHHIVRIVTVIIGAPLAARFLRW